MSNFKLESQIEYVVIGDPVAHSLSPQMQNAGFEALGMGSCYGKLHVTADNFSEFIDFARQSLKGFNITVPHKKRIIPYLDSISDEASLAGSVNTVIVKDGLLHGCSTDGYGLESALGEAFDFKLSGARVLFIGCGGAVQAVAFHFAANGAGELYFANRTVGKADALAQKISENYSGCKCTCCAINDNDQLKEFIGASTVAVQGTSLGLKPGDPLPIDSALLENSDICFYDTIYKKTPLLQAAQEAGLNTADGRTMLLHQGAKSFEIWTGEKPDIEKMRQALYCAIESKMEKK